MSLNHDNSPVSPVDLFEPPQNAPIKTSKWGDDMPTKDSRTLRIYFQNINGLPTNDDWAEWHHIVTYMKALEVDICGFVEPNINWTNQLTSTVKYKLSTMIRTSTLQTASCEEPTKYRYQRGGVMMATMGKMTGRIGATGKDIMGLGRWVYTKYFGRQGRTLIVVTAYRVAPNHMTIGI